MDKLMCVVLLSCLLVAALVDASSPLSSSPSSTAAQALGRKGKELHLLGYKHVDKHKKPEVTVAMKKPAEMKAGSMDQNDDTEEGLIYSADYRGVSMHSPPLPKHPRP